MCQVNDACQFDNIIGTKLAHHVHTMKLYGSNGYPEFVGNITI
jgi:hypothetical protein